MPLWKIDCHYARLPRGRRSRGCVLQTLRSPTRRHQTLSNESCTLHAARCFHTTYVSVESFSHCKHAPSPRLYYYIMCVACICTPPAPAQLIQQSHFQHSALCCSCSKLHYITLTPAHSQSPTPAFPSSAPPQRSSHYSLSAHVCRLLLTATNTRATTPTTPKNLSRTRLGIHPLRFASPRAVMGDSASVPNLDFAAVPTPSPIVSKGQAQKGDHVLVHMEHLTESSKLTECESSPRSPSPKKRMRSCIGLDILSPETPIIRAKKADRLYEPKSSCQYPPLAGGVAPKRAPKRRRRIRDDPVLMEKMRSLGRCTALRLAEEARGPDTIRTEISDLQKRVEQSRCQEIKKRWFFDIEKDEPMQPHESWIFTRLC